MSNLNELSAICHAANIKWWKDPTTGERIERNKGELLCLIHSEISEAMEGERKNLMDDKLPHRRMAEVELVDALIRIFDYAGAFGYDLQGAYDEKMVFNAQERDAVIEVTDAMVEAALQAKPPKANSPVSYFLNPQNHLRADEVRALMRAALAAALRMEGK